MNIDSKDMYITVDDKTYWIRLFIKEDNKLTLSVRLLEKELSEEELKDYPFFYAVHEGKIYTYQDIFDAHEFSISQRKRTINWSVGNKGVKIASDNSDSGVLKEEVEKAVKEFKLDRHYGRLYFSRIVF